MHPRVRIQGFVVVLAQKGDAGFTVAATLTKCIMQCEILARVRYIRLKVGEMYMQLPCGRLMLCDVTVFGWARVAEIWTL
jgi:hypothetical protein